MRVSKNINKIGNKFYLYSSIYLGCIGKLHGEKVFVTHIKKPDEHFYIKGQGYAINDELLLVLKRAEIKYILIPEDGKTGFRVYIARVSDYLNGEYIKDTEPQRVIPLKECVLTTLTKEDIERMMRYGIGKNV